MKWLLITNNANPGDIWVRVGVEAIIRRLDPDPCLIARERDYREGDPYNGLTTPVDFDYSVVCGMPLLWSHLEPNGSLSCTTQHAWWRPLTTWCCPEKMIVAGFGILLASPNAFNEWRMADEAVVPAVSEFLARCRVAYSRSPLAKHFFPAIHSTHCPSIFALDRSDQAPPLKLANFMPKGGHYPSLAPEASKTMEDMMPWLAGKLIGAGFHFAAHNLAEERLALNLGWREGTIHTWREDGSGVCLKDVYARCVKYFGNRIHGAIVSRSVGADVILIGYDTRLADVNSMNGLALTPNQASGISSTLEDWIASPPRSVPYDMELARKTHLSWWSERLKLAIRQ